jgi:hypothetical protein
MVGVVAQLVSDVRRETFTQVLAYSTVNARRQYSLSKSVAKVGLDIMGSVDSKLLRSLTFGLDP